MGETGGLSSVYHCDLKVFVFHTNRIYRIEKWSKMYWLILFFWGGVICIAVGFGILCFSFCYCSQC